MVNIMSWNVNGIRASVKKGFLEWLADENPLLLCIQETKIHEDQIPKELRNPASYLSYWSCAQRKGYSGTCTYALKEPLSHRSRFDIPHFDEEGRIVETEYNNFFLYNVYFPNGQKDDERLQYKLKFYSDFLEFTLEQQKITKKGVIIVGDFNTAHTEIDLKNPKANSKYSGFLPIEREWIDKYIAAGYIDIYRKRNPEAVDQYSWWSYRMNARERNIGWRIDYFMISPGLEEHVLEAQIHQDVMGSDHCPVSLTLDFDINKL